MSEFERWEARFSVPEYLFGTEPNEFLRANARLLPARGKALAVADGEGRNGVWLAEQGLDVLAIDYSPTALAKAETLARLGLVERLPNRGALGLSHNHALLHPGLLVAIPAADAGACSECCADWKQTKRGIRS